VHAIQTVRKDKNCQYTDRIAVGLVTEDATVRDAAERFRSYVEGETLCVRLVFEPIEGVEPVEVKLGGAPVEIYLQVVSP
jgi:isoleucyl-tRNA synthetase